MINKTLEILLVEDNDCDAELTIHAFKKNNLGNKIIRFSDGPEALNYLNSVENQQDKMENGFPKIILLDIKLPGLSGIEVLQKIKNNPLTKNIPVVMLTSSTEQKDIKTCYELGVNSYISKPVDFEKFVETMRTLGMYWLLLNQAP